MELEEFSNKISIKSKYLDININNEQIIKLYNYMQLLLQWNNRVNLTAILDPNEIIMKHFIDSMTINKFISKDCNVIDVGTGAGFPGIPIKIINEDVHITLLDSLNKRILFLQEVISVLELNKIIAIHGRAEDYGRDKGYTQKYDYATSRAVAPLNYLLEYMLPFIRVGGNCICMKGEKIDSELLDAKNAILKLGGRVKDIVRIKLPGTEIGRSIIIIEKINNTPIQYPRKVGVPKKYPL